MRNFVSMLLRDSGLGICIKNRLGEVLFRNKTCLDLCVDHQEGYCRQECLEHYVRHPKHQSADEGIRLFPNTLVRNNAVDLVLATDRDHIISLLYPLAGKRRELLELYRSKGLSAREIEVTSLVLEGRSNTAIAQALFISKATLKTHLNNIYKKLGPATSGLEARGQRKLLRIFEDSTS